MARLVKTNVVCADKIVDGRGVITCDLLTDGESVIKINELGGEKIISCNGKEVFSPSDSSTTLLEQARLHNVIQTGDTAETYYSFIILEESTEFDDSIEFSCYCCSQTGLADMTAVSHRAYCFLGHCTKSLVLTTEHVEVWTVRFVTDGGKTLKFVFTSFPNGSGDRVLHFSGILPSLKSQ